MLSLQDILHCSTPREIGDVIARTLPSARLPINAPTSTRIFFVHKRRVSEETHLVNSKLLRTLSTRKSTSESGTKKGLLYVLEESQE